MRFPPVALTAAVLLASFAFGAPTRADDGESDGTGPWEEVVFLPESALAVLLERDPRGVLLDRATYLDLYRRAGASHDGRGSSAGAPLQVLRCDVEGDVAGDSARLRVRLAVWSRDDGRGVLSLHPLTGAVADATLDGAPATVGSTGKGVMTLAVSGRGLHEAVLDVVAPVTRVKGRRSVVLGLPSAPAVRYRLDIPGRVTATVDDGLWRSERLDDPDRTRLVAFGATALRASWSEGDEGTDLPPLVRGTIHTLAEVGERSLDATVLVRIECARSPLGEFAMDLPDDLTVLGTEGASLVPTGPASGGRAPHVLRFAEPFTGTATVMIRAARALAGPGETALPVVDLPEAATVERRVAVRFRDGLRGVVDAGAGAVRLDPAVSEQGAVDAVLRIDADARPTARSERPAVELRADVRALVDLADDGPWLALSFLYRPRGDRLYGVDPLLPAGFLPERIDVAPACEFLRGTTPDGRLSLVFPGGVQAGGAVTVTLRGRWPVANWTDEAWSEGGDEREAALPQFDAGTSVESEGYLGVSVPAGVEVRDEDSAGLVAAPVSELRERGGFSAEGLTLGWLLRGPAPGGRLRVTRPAASVSASVTLLATPAEEHVTFDGIVALTVQRSGVREVRLRVDPPLGAILRVDGPDVAERRHEMVDGREIWTVRFTRLVRDGTTLVLRAELPLTDDSAAVPSVRVEGAARQDLRVGVAAAGELDVSTEATGLTDADAADFSPALGMPSSGLLRAWRADRDATPTLTVRAVRLPASPLPASFADSVVLRTVLGMDGIARTRLDAQVRNVDRQALEVVLPAGARLSSALVGGEAVRPVRNPSGALLVPIVPSAQPFPVVLVYEQPVAEGATAASLSAPDLGIPGAFATWTVYLPEGSLPIEGTGEFATAPARPGKPLLLRVFERGAIRVANESAGGGAPQTAARSTPARSPAAQPEMEEEAGADADDEMPEDSRAHDAARRPAAAPEPDTTGVGYIGGGDAFERGGGKPGASRIAARAAERGLFGMDIRLLAAGPSMTATRLGPTGTLDLEWRSAARRATVALLCGLLAFGAGLLARRRGFGGAAWTVIALTALTMLPIVFGAVDTAAWDGAAVGTLCFAVLALLRTIGGRVARWFPTRTSAAPIAALLLLLIATPALAQDRKVAPPAQDGVFVPYDPDRPQTLRVPERVFLPYERYRELWNRAHPEERIETAVPPVLVSATYEGRLEDRVLVVAARFEIDPSDGGIVALPPGAAVDDVLLDGRPVASTAAAPGGATLVPVPAGAAGSRAVLTATLRWPVGGTAPGGALEVPLPRIPNAHFTLDVPLADAVVTIATAGGHTESATTGGTHIDAALGAVNGLNLSWRPRGADAAGGRTRYEVDTETVATLRPRLIEWSSDVVLRVLAGTLQELDAVIPAGLELQSVEGAALASWTVTDGTSLRLRLLGVAAGESRLSLRGLVRLEEQPGEIAVPILSVPAASADRARVTVSGAEARLAVVGSTGMERTDAPAGAVAGALAFRRLRADGALTVRAEALVGGLAVASRQHLHLGANASLLRADIDLTPGPPGLFEARIALPAGWTLDDAAGAATFTEEGAVRLVFAGSPAAARTVTLRLRGPVAGSEAFPVPLLRVADAVRESTDTLVSTAPGFAVTAASAEGADAVPAGRFANWAALALVEQRSLAWSAPRGVPTLSVRRETLRTTARPTVIADVTVLDDRVIVDALVHWDVRGGPERVFQVDAPEGVRDPWVLGEGLRDVQREMVDGRERLTVTMQAAATGAVAFRVLYELPVPTGDEIVVAGPEPVGGEAARAFLMLRALGDAEVRIGESTLLETCDVADLPFLPEGLDPVRVLRFLRTRDAAWRLPLRLAAHELGDLPDARIHLVEATTVVDRDGSARTRVLVRLFNRALGFLPVQLPPGAALESVIVAGAPVRPVTRASAPGQVQVPVRVQSLGEESQVVSLTFRSPAVAPRDRFDSIEPLLTEFPGVPVDATTWRLLLPEDGDYAFSGNLDLIEEVDVAFARADAYTSDNFRLRAVLAKGSRQQQAVAAENLLLNSQELQQTLDVARERMAELEQAAAEGRVDQERLVQSRRKAEELAKNIADVLKDVEQSEVRLGLEAGQTDAPADKQTADRGGDGQKQLDRWATKEGQVGKKWGANTYGDVPPPPTVTAQQQGVGRRGVFALDEKNVQSETAAVAAQELFDDVPAAQSGYFGPGGEIPADSRDPMDPPPPDGGGAGGPFTGGGDIGGPTTGGAENTTIGIGYGSGAASGGGHFTARGAGAGGGFYRMGGGAGGGGGRAPAAARAVAPPVAGLVSLEPPLIERGRSYAFRKLDSGAEITVSTRTEGRGRRAIALLVLVVVAAGVWFLRSRAGRRRATSARGT